MIFFFFLQNNFPGPDLVPTQRDPVGPQVRTYEPLQKGPKQISGKKKPEKIKTDIHEKNFKLLLSNIP